MFYSFIFVICQQYTASNVPSQAPATELSTLNLTYDSKFGKNTSAFCPERAHHVIYRLKLKTKTDTHLSLQVDHVSLHFIVGFIEVVNLFVELLDVLIVVQN